MTPRTGLDRRVALRIAACALGFRIVTAIIGFFVNLAFPLDRARQMTFFSWESPFWDTFVRWDSGWYGTIARDGYAYVEGGRSNIAFFPVYPLLMKHVGRLFGTYYGAVNLGGLLISWVSFVLAMVVLYYLARLDLPRRTAERAALLAAVFPFSFFFGVVYSESTFLLFTLLAFYLFRTRQWMLAGVCAAIAIATRVTGIMMWPALALIAWQSAEPTWRDRSRAAAGLALATVGFVWYSAYIYSLSGHPFEWAATLQRWGYYPGNQPWIAPFQLIQRLVTEPYAYLLRDKIALYETLYGVTGICFLAITPMVWRRFGAGYALFMLLNLLLPMSSGVFEGVGRYCSILFPCFLWLATIRSRTISTMVLVTFALFYTLGLALFTTVHLLF